MYKSKFNQQIIEAISWDGDNTKAVLAFCKPRRHILDENLRTLTLNWDFTGNVLNIDDYIYKDSLGNRFISTDKKNFERMHELL